MSKTRDPFAAIFGAWRTALTTSSIASLNKLLRKADQHFECKECDYAGYMRAIRSPKKATKVEYILNLDGVGDMLEFVNEFAAKCGATPPRRA